MVIRAKQLDQWTAAFSPSILTRRCCIWGAVWIAAWSALTRQQVSAGIDLDYPEVIEVRRRLYPPREGYSLIGSEVSNPTFLEQVSRDQPAMIVAEGLSMYLSDQEVKDLLQRLTDHFKSGQVAFDAHSRLSLQRSFAQSGDNQAGSGVSLGHRRPARAGAMGPATPARHGSGHDRNARNRQALLDSACAELDDEPYSRPAQPRTLLALSLRVKKTSRETQAPNHLYLAPTRGV